MAYHKPSSSDSQRLYTPVMHCQRDVKMLFVRRVSFLVAIDLFIIFVVSWRVTRDEHMARVLIHQSYVIAIAVVMSIVVTCIYWFSHFQTWNRASQYFALLLTTASLTLVVILVSGYSQSDVFMRALLLVDAIVFLLFLYTLQTCIGYSTGWALLIVTLLSLGTISYYYWPYINGSGTNVVNWETEWLSPPSGSFETILTICVTVFLAIYFILDLNSSMKQCAPQNYVYAAFRSTVNIVYIFILLTRFLCNPVPSRKDVVSQVVTLN